MQVKQFYNKNQFVISTEEGYYFQSYNSVVAMYYYDFEKGKHILVLGCDWCYSKTTLKHLYLFMQDYCYYNYYKLIENASNKKQAIKKLIEKGVILYSEKF